MLSSRSVLLVCLFAVQACAHAPVPAEPTPLPLRHVRLYETGIAYFERSGELGAGAEAGLPVPASHLDDALKTLVVLGASGKTQVHGLEFNSSVSPGMARALAGLPASVETPLGHKELLASLKGVQVELSVPETLTGRIIEVLEESVPKPAAADPKSTPVERLAVLFLTDRGEIRRIATEDIRTVRPLDPTVALRLSGAVDAVSTRAQTRRMMRLLAQTSGPVTLGYIAEAPLWRTTWRLVLSDEKQATLQGWALLHNDSDEDWQQVRIELVNGRPDSFLYPLASPRYSRRALVHPEEALSTVPQLLHDTADSLWGENTETGGLGLSGTGAGAGGMGLGLGSIGTKGAGGGVAGYGQTTEGASSLLAVGDLAEVKQATGVEAGALFSYALPDPVDMRAHGSALVPFLQEPIVAKPVARLEGVGEAARAAIKLTNSTHQTLPAGTLAVFAYGGLAGETGLDRLKPAETRILTFGMDLDVSVERPGAERVTEEVRALSFNGALEEHYLRSSESTWVVENRSGVPRQVLVGLHLVNNARVEGADLVDHDPETRAPLAAFDLKARTRVERAMKFEEGMERRTELAGITTARLTQLAAMTSVPESQRTVAADAAAKSKVVDETLKTREKTSSEISKIDGDLDRVRKHLTALGGEKAAAAANPFVQRILALEDKLTAARARLEGLDTALDDQRKAVRDALARLRSAH